MARKRLEIFPGQKIGKLTAIKYSHIDKKGQQIWLWECDCENKTRKKITCSNVNTKNVKSCGCINFLSGSSSRYWKGYQDISGRTFSILKNNAKKRNIIFNISIKYLWKLYVSQNKRCALSGISISFPRTTRSHKDESTASLDRIDSTKGYIKGNVQWVHKDVNWMKQDYSQEEYIHICKLVAETHKNG